MIYSEQKIKILQWNIRSIACSKGSLIHIINKYKINIIVLSEIWLKKHQCMNIKGFNVIQKLRDDGYGGVAIYIAQSIPYIEKEIYTVHNTGIEACAVELYSGEYSFVSIIYRPPSANVTTINGCNIFSQFGNKTIYCGNFNCRHIMWGNLENTTQGNILYNAMDEFDLICANDGSPTRVHLPGKSTSVLDLTIISPSIADKVSWEVLHDTFGSDHYPILVSMESNFTQKRYSQLQSGITFV
nr:unnamed protein product [Callosobruchus chinensis]